ncbi:MAG: hypothetical protein WC479_10095 [Candidatus Izemoplasmatales bacterium]|jgi:hypothetical protein
MSKIEIVDKNKLMECIEELKGIIEMMALKVLNSRALRRKVLLEYIVEILTF